ncbi:MAG: hypothetical protein N2235_03115 [Fischerella sp.]|nr:hypothetical protein [Fischerella sp.]
MAVIREEALVIKISRLFKNENQLLSTESDLSDTIIDNIETIVQELVGDGAIVEVEKISMEK